VKIKQATHHAQKGVKLFLFLEVESKEEKTKSTLESGRHGDFIQSPSLNSVS